MKASEMTNEQLCSEIEDGACNLARPYRDILREAAARLHLKQQSDNYAAALGRQESKYKREICDLRQRLKVAEDAGEEVKSNRCPRCGQEPMTYRATPFVRLNPTTILGDTRYVCLCYPCGLLVKGKTRDEAIAKWNEMTKGGTK